MNRSASGISRLTPTQVAVVNLLSHGYGTRGAAAFLGISPKTVQIHVDNAMLKTHATNREHLVAEYVRHAEMAGLRDEGS